MGYWHPVKVAECDARLMLPSWTVGSTRLQSNERTNEEAAQLGSRQGRARAVSDVNRPGAQVYSCRQSRTPSRSRAPAFAAPWTAGGWRLGSCAGSERQSAALRCVQPLSKQQNILMYSHASVNCGCISDGPKVAKFLSAHLLPKELLIYQHRQLNFGSSLHIEVSPCKLL